MTTRPREDAFDTGGSSPAAPHVHDPVFEPLRDALRPVYQLLRRLGEGGMGAVYLAREPGLKRDVAVKVMLPWLALDETARARFDREAQAVAAIAHPNVINIFGTGELADGTPYFVMQFVRGRSLEERLGAEGAMGVREARRVLAEVAAALAAAHGRGIIHRDIKAANVLQDAESGRVVVTDFGIAAVRDQAELPNSKLTQPDSGSPGTPAYMAPEQLLGEETTEASDVYAFGLLAYELLTGAGPFRAISPHEMAAAHLRDEPAPLSQHRDDVDADLEHLVTTCLAKKPADRPTSISLVQRLPPGDALSLEWPPPGLETAAGRFPRMARRLGLGSALLAAAILGMILADPDGGVSLPLWLLETAALAGGLLLLSAVSGTQRLMRDVRRALRHGYGWLPIMEVLADPRGDTGAMITGLREFAALPRAARSRLRAGRLLAAACAFGAAVAPLLSLLVVIRLAAAGVLSPRAAAVAVILPSVLLVDAVWLLRLFERRQTQGRRGPRRRRGASAQPPIARNVVQAWNESFDAARTGQTLGSRAPNPLLTRAAIGATLIAVALSVLLVAPLAMMPMVGAILFGTTVPKFSAAIAKVRRAEAGRAWVLYDSTISADVAGAALHALVLAGQRTIPRDIRPPAAPITDPLFLAQGSPFGHWSVNTPDSVLRLAARRDLNPAQRAWLQRIASNPGQRQIRTAARALGADVVSARYSDEVLASSGRWDFMLPRFAVLKEAAYAAVGVAALRLSQGRGAEAESLLRDVVGLGFRMQDNGLNLLETLVGTTIVTTGLNSLATYYDVTGRAADGQRLRVARDAAQAEAERSSVAADAVSALGLRDPAQVYRVSTLSLMSDSTMPGSFRWEFVSWASDLPCFNARELVFGSAPEVDSALAAFRRQVVRTRGDTLWFAAQQRAMRAAGPAKVRRSVSAAFARLLGNPRLGRCLNLAMGIY